FLRGAFLGALAELREVSPEELAAEVSGLARAPAEQMVTAGGFLAGVLAVSHPAILLGADALVAAIDELLPAAAWEPLLVGVRRRLRGGFGQRRGRRGDWRGGGGAARYGRGGAEEVAELRPSVAAAARIARIDEQVARIMERWNF